MTVTHSIPSTLLVAIDISKHRHEVLIGIPGKTRRRRLTILNTLEDFQRLSATLASYHLPVRIELFVVVVVVVASFAIAVLATIYPSRSAAGLTPVEAIRHE